jgi:hypothetical protein
LLQRYSCHVSTAFLAAAVAVLACAPIALAHMTAAVLDPQGSSVASFSGWTVWSRKVALGEYQLVARSPSGMIETLSPPEQAGRFAVELGPSATGGVAAVYPICSSALADSQSCQVEELQLGVPGAPAKTVMSSSSAAIDDVATWKAALVYLEDAGSAKASKLVWRSGGVTHAEALPMSVGIRVAGEPWQKGTPAVSGIRMLSPTEVAFDTRTESGDFAMTSLFVENLHSRKPELIDQYTSGAGALCEQELLPATTHSGWLYAYIHVCQPGEGDAWLRYKLNSNWQAVEKQRSVSLVKFSDEMIESVALYGNGGVAWVDPEPAEGSLTAPGLEYLASVPWTTVKGFRPDTSFCGRRHPLC